jgi:flagellar biosynthesis protein FlhG
MAAAAAPKFNLFHVLKGEKSMKEAMIQGPGGIMILPSASGIQEMSNLSKGQKLTLLDELRAVSREMDFLLIDTAAGIVDNVMYFNMAAHEIIVVASPEPTSLTDAYAIIKVLHKNHAKNCFRLLVNMVRTRKRRGVSATQSGNGSLSQFAYRVSRVHSRDEKLSDAVKQQKAFTTLYLIPRQRLATSPRSSGERTAGVTGGKVFSGRGS